MYAGTESFLKEIAQSLSLEVFDTQLDMTLARLCEIWPNIRNPTDACGVGLQISCNLLPSELLYDSVILPSVATLLSITIGIKKKKRKYKYFYIYYNNKNSIINYY